MRARQFLFSSIIVATLTAPAFADTIQGLYNTGTNNSGNVLNDGLQDGHYAGSIINATDSGGHALSGGFTPYSFSSGSNWPISSAPASAANGASGQWIGSNSNSGWLTLTSSAGVSLDPYVTGEYKFTLAFTIGENYNLNTASFSGQWAADNYGAIYLNGTEIAAIGNPRSNNQSDGMAYNHWNSFAVGAGSGLFNTGVNTLTFDVFNIAQNGGNPMGLRVEFTDSNISAGTERFRNVSPVPEPETYAMLLAGLGLMGFVAHRRKHKAA